MKFFDTYRKVKAIEELATTRGNTGGLVKRIDENRELLELMQKEAPEFVSSHPWLIGWIEANDQFFVQLNGILGTAMPPHMPNYPRPWPALSQVKNFVFNPKVDGHRVILGTTRDGRK